MGKRPAGARHIRTSAQGSASPAPEFSRPGGLPETQEGALDGVLSLGPAVGPAPGIAFDAMEALLALPVEGAISDADQAALDLDAILSMAFELEPEPAAVPEAAAGPLSDDLLDDLLGDWDLGSTSDDQAAEFLAESDDFGAPPVEAQSEDAQSLDASSLAASPAESASATPMMVETPAGAPADTAPPARRGRRQHVPAVEDFDLQDDGAVETLPDLDLDDLFALDPTPVPPRSRGPVEDLPLPKTPVRDKGRAVPELDRALRIGAARPSAWAKWRPRLIWAVILAGMVYVAFLPYPYEVGGDFVVQPLQRSEARSRTDGEIIRVNVKEGDWVGEGDILAILSNWDELRDVAVNEADGAVLRAKLETMENGAKPEEIAVAREAVTSAELLVAVTQKDLDRQQILFDSGTIAEKVLETARNAHAAAVSARDEALAMLALVSSAAQQSEIDAAKAAIARNQQELEFARLMVEYANIRAPQEGQIVSSLSGVPVGAYLRQGGLFAELENNRTVIAEVDMPETYIQEVEIGAEAELRLWSDPERSIYGTVRGIAPRAEERDFGWVIRVEVEVPNPDGRLAANMTGFGKVAATERPVWQAFTEAIVGFFKIELWSWVP